MFDNIEQFPINNEVIIAKEKKNYYMREWNKRKTKTDPEWAKKRTAQKRKAGKIYYHKHKQEIKEYTLFINAKSRARKRGMEFTIKLSDVMIPDYCPILGIKLNRVAEKYWSDNSPSLDRIDNNEGYVKGNIQIISALANTMKNKATPSQLLAFANWVYNTYGE